MKKLLVILGVILSVNTFAFQPVVIEHSDSYESSSAKVTTVCIEGYLHVVVIGNQGGVAVSQVMRGMSDISERPNRPVKCK